MSTLVATPLAISAPVSAAATLQAGKHTPVDATSAAVTVTLPAAAAGAHLSVEKFDAGVNAVTVSGSIRGSASTVVLSLAHESVEFVADAAGSWWPIAGLPLAALDSRTDGKVAAQHTADVAAFDPTVSGLVTNPASATGAALSAAFGKSAADSTARTMSLLHSETRDASILVVGDSTGVTSDRWVYRLAVLLGADWPRWRVIFRWWDDPSSSYGSVAQPDVTLQTGTGPRTLTVYNASVSGTTTDDWQGVRAAAAVYALTPDLIVLSMGHNEQALTPDLWHSRYIALTESLTEGLPSADLLLIMQNPESANTYQQARWDVYREIAARRGYGLVDVGQAFLDTDPTSASLLVDGIHPNTTGSILWAATVKPAFTYSKGATPRPQQPSTLTAAAEQLLVNGDFSAFSGAFPDSWTLYNCAASKDVTNYESGNGYAVKLTTASVGAYFSQYIPIGRVRGRWVTVAVRLFVPTGSVAQVGRVGVGDNLGSTLGIGFVAAGAQGRYRWAVASRFIAATATNCRALIYIGTTAGDTCTIDRIIMSVGKYPHAGSNAQRGPAGAPGAPGAGAGGFDHLSTLGTIPTLSATGNTSLVLGAASQGIFVPIIPARNTALALLNWMPGVVSGNYDIGIFDNAGTRLWSKGSTAVSSGAKVETVSPVVNLVAGTTYWVGFSFDNITAQIYGLSLSNPGVGGLQLLTGASFARTVSAVFPLPTTVTLGAVGSSKIPLVVLREA